MPYVYTISLVLVAICLNPKEVVAGGPSAEETLREWAKTFRSARIADMIAFYEDSDDVVAIESTGKARLGAAGIRKMYADAFGEVVFESVAIENLKVRTDGDFAWATCKFNAQTMVRADQSQWTLYVHTSFVLIRGNGKWKIVLEHFSPMADVPRVERRKPMAREVQYKRVK